MADKSIVFKTQVELANLDRHKYENMRFTIALNPLESIEHLVMRILALSVMPDIPLSFSKKGANKDTPDLMLKNEIDDFDFWVEVGQPDVERVKKASHKANHVVVVTERDSNWMQENLDPILRLSNINLIAIEHDFIEALSNSIEKSIKWSVVLEGNKLSISNQQQFFSTHVTDYHSSDEPTVFH